MEIRAYKQGDIESIEFNDIGQKEWEENPDRPALKNGEAYTIIVGEHKCVLAVEDLGRYYYLWIAPDRNISPLYLKAVKKIVDNVGSRGKPLVSISYKGKMQEKMHRFLGGEIVGEYEGKDMWRYVNGWWKSVKGRR